MLCSKMKPVLLRMSDTKGFQGLIPTEEEFVWRSRIRRVAMHLQWLETEVLAPQLLEPN